MLGQYIAHCEDSLTASIVSHLLHLPVEVFWKIFRGACYGKELPEDSGEPQHLDLLPKWDPTGTHNNTYVEPDVFIRFRDFDLIIEAKRWDEGMQDRGQWQRELIAYTNEYGEEKRPVLMVALGGLYGTESEEIGHTWHSSEPGPEAPGDHVFVCPVIMCRWRGLLNLCQRMRREIARSEFPDSHNFATTRILEDVVSLFSWHGYSTGKWFSDFEFARHFLRPNTALTHQVFRSRSLQLSHP